MDEESLSVNEVARIFRVNTTTVGRWIKQGILEADAHPGRSVGSQKYSIKRKTVENILGQIDVSLDNENADLTATEVAEALQIDIASALEWMKQRPDVVIIPSRNIYQTYRIAREALAEFPHPEEEGAQICEGTE